MFLLCFNPFISLYVPKELLRSIYIIPMIYIFFRSARKRRIIATDYELLIIVYLIFSFLRFCCQIIDEGFQVISIVGFFQLFMPVWMFFLAKNISSIGSAKIEKYFIIFASISSCLGLLDMFMHFLPEFASDDVYAAIGNGTFIVRGYSLAGGPLTTGFICGVGVYFLFWGLCVYKYSKIFCLVAGGPLVIGLVVSLSRGAMFMLLIACLFCGILSLLRRKMVFDLKKIILAFIIVMFMISFTAVYQTEIENTMLYGRMINAGLDMSEGSNSARLNFWQNAIKALSDDIVFGRGFGYVGYNAASLENINAINTESYLLSLLANGGILLLGLYVFIMVAKLVVIIQYGKKNQYKYYSLAFGIFCWSIVYIVLDSDLTGMVFWYCLGKSCFSDEVHL